MLEGIPQRLVAGRGVARVFGLGRRARSGTLSYMVIVPDVRSKATPHSATTGVSGRYRCHRHDHSLAANAAKLRAIMRFFGLTPTEVARAVGMSRCYVSRVASERDSFVGHAKFFRLLEQRIGVLIQERSSQVFDIEPVAVERPEELLR